MLSAGCRLIYLCGTQTNHTHTMATVITPARARKIYRNAMANLDGALKVYKHQVGTDSKGKPKYREGLAVFCEVTGLSRQNLQEVLACKTERTMSLGTYLRVMEALGIIVVPANVERYSGPAFGYSLQMFFEIDSNLVKDATLALECQAYEQE